MGCGGGDISLALRQERKGPRRPEGREPTPYAHRKKGKTERKNEIKNRKTERTKERTLKKPEILKERNKKYIKKERNKYINNHNWREGARERERERVR